MCGTKGIILTYIKLKEVSIESIIKFLENISHEHHRVRTAQDKVGETTLFKGHHVKQSNFYEW